VLATVRESKSPLSLEEVARAAKTDDVETVYWILRHLAANGRIMRALQPNQSVFDAKYRAR
jgi:glucose-6-phosphate isomerase